MTAGKTGDDRSWDVFISHASEDKGHLVRSLARALSDLGVRVWYDEFSLKPGDSISASIDRGLADSRIGLIVLSPHFIGKRWPGRELAGLTAIAMSGRGRIIPVWHQVELHEVLNFSPPLADMLAIRTEGMSAPDLAITLLGQVRPDLYASLPRDELMRRASGSAFADLQAELEAAKDHLAEFQCPHCGADLAERISAPVDGDQKHWDEVVSYECGFQTFAGAVQTPCPADPRFPAFTDYELDFREQASGEWLCAAIPKTRMARAVSLSTAIEATRDAALAAIKDSYRRQAPKRLHPD